MNYFVSIIVPVYNVEPYLENCIESIIHQTYDNWELILVDDGSIDESGRICDEYVQKDTRIIVIHKENGGQSTARNAGLDLPPKGEFVTFLDSDDFWHPQYLRHLIKLQQTYDADIVQCSFIRGTTTSFPQIKSIDSIEVLDNHEIFLREKANVIMPCKLYRRCLFDNVRMPVGLYNEDDWTAWKLYYRSSRIVVTTEKLYYYTMNPTSTMARLRKKPDLRYIEAYKERINFFGGKGEKDLEDSSRLQFCKALLLTFANRHLRKNEKSMLLNEFVSNWKKIRQSCYIPLKYKCLFWSFSLQPTIVSRLVSIIRSV